MAAREQGDMNQGGISSESLILKEGFAQVCSPVCTVALLAAVRQAENSFMRIHKGCSALRSS